MLNAKYMTFVTHGHHTTHNTTQHNTTQHTVAKLIVLQDTHVHVHAQNIQQSHDAVTLLHSTA